jgi:hypothetical protein
VRGRIAGCKQQEKAERDVKTHHHRQRRLFLRPQHQRIGDETTPGVRGTKAGEHAFRRYRNGYLRKKSCPSVLLKYWMGHSRNIDMTDNYDGSVEDEAWRLETAEQMGTGFTVPNCTEKEKEATGAVASK